MIREEVFFPCSGVSCHGILYRPDGGGDGRAVVMAMGFGMVKEAHADDYGAYFAERGFTVLAFDYRRFGRSGGYPRQALYPMDQVSDYRCAVSWLLDRGLAEPGRVCLWGTSFSGGHVLTLLAFPQPGVACGVAQVPNVYSYRTALHYFGSLEPVMMLAEQGRRACCTGRPEYISIVSEKGEPAVIMTEEAREYYLEKARELETFENRITLDSIDRVLAYNPGDYAHLIRKPVMLVVASRDQTTPPDLAREVASRIPGRVELLEVEGGHFDVYRDPLLSRVREAEADFMEKVLRGG